MQYLELPLPVQIVLQVLDFCANAGAAASMMNVQAIANSKYFIGIAPHAPQMATARRDYATELLVAIRRPVLGPLCWKTAMDAKRRFILRSACRAQCAHLVGVNAVVATFAECIFQRGQRPCANSSSVRRSHFHLLL